MGANHTNKRKDKMSGKEAKPSDNSSSGASSSRPLSIEGPRMQQNNPSNVEIAPNQPRQPRDLQGVLRFAMEATRAEDSPHESHYQPLDEERKQFLQSALSSMAVNVTQELLTAIGVLKNVNELGAHDDTSQCEAELEKVADLVDNIDLANDFHRVGGFTVLKSCLNSLHSGIRWRTAVLIAELTQNNPYCQEKILEAGLLPILLNMVDCDPLELARVKSLYAVSCLVRENPKSLLEMDKHDGYSVLMRAMQSPVEKLQIKSAFLLSALCGIDGSDKIKATLVKMGLIEQIAGLLKIQNILPETREQLLSALYNLASGNYFLALKECRRPELSLKPTLEMNMQALHSEEDVDGVQKCKQLLDTIFFEAETEQER